MVFPHDPEHTLARGPHLFLHPQSSPYLAVTLPLKGRGRPVGPDQLQQSLVGPGGFRVRAFAAGTLGHYAGLSFLSSQTKIEPFPRPSTPVARHRHPQLSRKSLYRLSPQQTQAHLALAGRAPALHRFVPPGVFGGGSSSRPTGSLRLLPQKLIPEFSNFLFFSLHHLLGQSILLSCLFCVQRNRGRLTRMYFGRSKRLRAKQVGTYWPFQNSPQAL